MASKLIAKATYKDWPHEYLVHLRQTGPRTFVWYSGTFRCYGTPNFRTAAAAIQFAEDVGWQIV